jgi:N-acetylglucosamine kinase-like BadF-type ATPase
VTLNTGALSDAALPAVLAIDGGNSKTDVALVAADGTLLASARGPGVPGMLVPDQTLRVLGSAAREAAAAAGRPADAPGQRIAVHLSACVANADLPEEERRLHEILLAEGWTDTVHVANDTFAVLRAGLDGPGPHWGAAVTCGAGINCVAVAPGGRTARYLALGDFTGDWGGGQDLSRQVLWSAARAEDGRGPATALRDGVCAHLGAASMYDVAVGLHTQTIGWDRALGLTSVLFAAAAAGDEVAVDLVRRLADEICVMALAALRRLGLDDQPVPVALGGGLMRARDPLLTAEVTRRFADAVPKATVRIVDAPPVAGAALLGLDHIGAPPEAEARLRDSYWVTSPGHAGPVRGVHRPLEQLPDAVHGDRLLAAQQGPGDAALAPVQRRLRPGRRLPGGQEGQ